MVCYGKHYGINDYTCAVLVIPKKAGTLPMPWMLTAFTQVPAHMVGVVLTWPRVVKTWSQTTSCTAAPMSPKRTPTATWIEKKKFRSADIWPIGLMSSANSIPQNPAAASIIEKTSASASESSIYYP